LYYSCSSKGNQSVVVIITACLYAHVLLEVTGYPSGSVLENFIYETKQHIQYPNDTSLWNMYSYISRLISKGTKICTFLHRKSFIQIHIFPRWNLHILPGWKLCFLFLLYTGMCSYICFSTGILWTSVSHSISILWLFNKINDSLIILNTNLKYPYYAYWVISYR
jgi:hypothetical protein